MEEIPYDKLPLGFRFRPTDEQLINHYLKRKTNGTIQPLESLLIPEIDVCRTEPWDLPSKWRVKSSYLEWFFFAAVERKYPLSNRSNRATKNGYWKPTGKDRLIKSKKVLVGMKKTLVFHFGRSPRGTRSCWIMHEYRVVNPDGTDVVGAEGAFVLGRLFKKDKDILNITPLSQVSPDSDLSDEPRINPENTFGQLTEYNVADDEVLPYLVPPTMEPEQSHSNSGITTNVGSHQELRIKQELLNSTNQLYRKMEELPYDKLPLGFRFRPTDEQLIDHYLKRKTNGTIQPLESWVIPEIDVCSTEPWDLPSKWRVKSSDLEWFFFSAIDRKYPSSNRSNRATQNGYWKATGKDRLIKSKKVLVGMKKSLIFHIGRAPRGAGSCWIMHEYRVVNPDGTDIVGDEGTFVLCRLFKKDKDILNITPLSQASPNPDLSDELQINPESTSGQITEFNVANDEVLPYLIHTTIPKQSHSNSNITTDVCTHEELRIIQEIKADMDKEGSSSRNPNPAAEQHQSPNFFMDAGGTNVIHTVNGQIMFQQTFK